MKLTIRVVGKGSKEENSEYQKSTHTDVQARLCSTESYIEFQFNITSRIIPMLRSECD